MLPELSGFYMGTKNVGKKSWWFQRQVILYLTRYIELLRTFWVGPGNPHLAELIGVNRKRFATAASERILARWKLYCEWVSA